MKININLNQINLNQKELEKLQTHLQIKELINEFRQKYPEINLALAELESNHGELKYTSICEFPGKIEINYLCPNSKISYSGLIIIRINNFDKYSLSKLRI